MAVLAAVVAVAGAVVLLPGHGAGPDGTHTGVRLVGAVQQVDAGSVAARQVAAGQSMFGLDLLARRCAEQPTANQVLSPASAALAIGMLGAGAAGDTRTAIDRLLRLPTGGTGLPAAQRQQSLALHTLGQLRVSNHVYTQTGVRPRQGVLDELATAYDSDLRVVDFAHQPVQATDTINRSVDQDTRGLIHRLFDQPLDSATVTVLTDAIYLHARWQQDFGPATPAAFRTAAGRQVQVQMMDGGEQPGQLRRTGGWTSVTLPYRQGQLQAVVLLPDTVGPACQAPTAGELTSLTSGPSEPSGVDLPELHLQQTSDLTATLSAMGLPVGGDYSGFGAAGTSVSQVLQKTVLDVDERGTTAAAVTGVELATSGRIGGQRADRPFYLLVRDIGTQTPLFLAHISDPTVTG